MNKFRNVLATNIELCVCVCVGGGEVLESG